MMHRPSRSRKWSAHVTAMAVAVGLIWPALATDLKRGDPAPVIETQAIDGRTVNTAAAHESVLIVLFGDLAQERTLDAARRIAAVITDPRFADSRPQWIVSLSKDDGAGRFVESLGAGVPAPLIVKDGERKLFGAYHVVVLPTMFVVGSDNRIAHALAGVTPRFNDLLGDAIDLARGRITAEDFDRRSAGGTETKPSESRLRSERLTRLAQHLMQRDMAAMAESKLREATEVDATYTAARMLLARLLMAQGKLDDAEVQFRKMLEAQAHDDEATLGLVEVQVRRGGPALATAEQQLAPLRAVRSEWPRVRYVNGLLQEARGDSAKAAAEFKAAAELLLREAETHTLIDGTQPPAPDDG